MIKVIRNPAQRINFKKEQMIEPERRSPTIKQVAKFKNAEQEDEIDQKFEALEQTAVVVGKIQEEIDSKTKTLEEKEKTLKQKEQELNEKEQDYLEEIQKLKEKPWAGKSSKQIEKENQELKKQNKELSEEIESVLTEIEKMQEE